MSLDLELVNLDEFAGSMNLSEESPMWIWMNESAEPVTRRARIVISDEETYRKKT